MKPRRSSQFFVYDIEAPDYLTVFLVCGVATVFLIRFFLSLTGYPSIGGEGLHIAHMLWGGLAMTAAIVLLLASLTRASTLLAAVIGGGGFGAFIDEVGKFVTRDNDYFFQPAASIIYLTFIGLFLMLQALRRRTAVSPATCLVNSMQYLKEAVVRDLDHDEQVRARELLSRCDPQDPKVQALASVLDSMEALEPEAPGVFEWLLQGSRRLYVWLVGRRWFAWLVIAFFVVTAVVRLVLVVSTLTHLFTGWEGVDLQRDLGGWLRLGSATVADLFVIAGVAAMLRGRRMRAYRAFEIALLVNIFLTDVFVFYEEQFGAVLTLVADIVILSVIRSLIRRESELRR